MSIYATLHIFQIETGYNNEKHDFNYEYVAVQAVPWYVGHPSNGYETDPYVSFLPELCDEKDLYRAVFIVTKSTKKEGQKYINPLMSMTGKEYNEIKFDYLMSQIRKKFQGE